MNINGCVLTGGSNAQIASGGGALYVTQSNTTVNLTGATITNNTATVGAGILVQAYNAPGQSVNLSNCVVSGNNNDDFYIANGGSQSVHLLGGNTIGAINLANAGITVAGVNTIKFIIARSGTQNTITISSGAIITLGEQIRITGDKGGSIIVLTGGCTVNGNVIPAGTYTTINSNGQAT